MAKGRRSHRRKRQLRRGADPRLARREAKTAQARLRAAIEAMPQGVVFLDEEKRYILWNQRYAEIYANSADLFRPGAHLKDTLRIGVERGDYPDAYGREEQWIAERLAKLHNPGEPHEQQLADGRWILIEERRMADGCTIGLRVDVTEIKQKEQTFRLLFEDNPVPMFLYEAGTREIAEANEAACTHYGYRREDLIGRNIALLEDTDHDEWCAEIEADDQIVAHRKADGERIDVTMFTRHMTHNGQPSVLLAAIDVTERRRTQARFEHMARHDALTGLPNRALFREHAESMIARMRTSHEGFAVLLFDLDHFKGVNDTLGHSVGDLLLQETAQRILCCIGAADMAARLGGDEFAILHAGVDSATEIVERIVAALKRPFEIDDQIIQIGASVGVAFAPRDGDDPERLLKNADLALYAAKAAGRGAYVFFQPDMDAKLQKRRLLEIELRAALINGELDVHYQPLIELSTDKFCGCEALLRWNHPERGYISPAEFVPLAEDTGLIGALGQMVLQRACADAARWPDDIKVAVNLSPAQFRNGSVLDTVMQALAASGLPPHRLDLEITEALLLDRGDATLAVLNGLRALGIGISMDDFGTGYSSLIYLRNFPFTKIKIDKSFVRGLHASIDSQAIVRAILSLAASLGLRVLAEGIEDESDLAFLRGAGCQEGQGFLFSQAKPVHELFPDAAPAAPIVINAATHERREGSRRRATRS